MNTIKCLPVRIALIVMVLFLCTAEFSYAQKSKAGGELRDIFLKAAKSPPPPKVLKAIPAVPPKVKVTAPPPNSIRQGLGTLPKKKEPVKQVTPAQTAPVDANTNVSNEQVGQAKQALDQAKRSVPKARGPGQERALAGVRKADQNAAVAVTRQQKIATEVSSRKGADQTKRLQVKRKQETKRRNEEKLNQQRLARQNVFNDKRVQGKEIEAKKKQSNPADSKKVPYVVSGPMKGKRIGHTFKKHGSHNTPQLKLQAQQTGRHQGQWLDDVAAEQFIAKHVDKLTKGPRTFDLPPGLGREILPDGTFIPATKARLVPSKSGVKTAYPVN